MDLEKIGAAARLTQTDGNWKKKKDGCFVVSPSLAWRKAYTVHGDDWSDPSCICHCPTYSTCLYLRNSSSSSSAVVADVIADRIHLDLIAVARRHRHGLAQATFRLAKQRRRRHRCRVVRLRHCMRYQRRSVCCWRSIGSLSCDGSTGGSRSRRRRRALDDDAKMIRPIDRARARQYLRQKLLDDVVFRVVRHCSQTHSHSRNNNTHKIMNECRLTCWHYDYRLAKSTSCQIHYIFRTVQSGYITYIDPYFEQILCLDGRHAPIHTYTYIHTQNWLLQKLRRVQSDVTELTRFSFWQTCSPIGHWLTRTRA